MSLSVRIKEKFCEINDFYASPSLTEVFCGRMVLPGNLLLFSYSPPWAMLSVFPYRSLLPSSDTQIPRLLNQRSAFSGSGALTQDSAIFISRSVDGYTGDWNKSSGLSQVWKEIILLSSLHKKLIVPPPPNYLATTKMPIFRLLLFPLFLLTFGVCGLSLCVIYTLNSAGAASYSRCLWDLPYQRSITCSLGYPCEVGLWCLLKLASCDGA